MSGVPKRTHEEGVGSVGGSGSLGHSSSSSGLKYPHEDASSYQKLTPPGIPHEYHHPPYDMGSDSRMPKIPRNESRDYSDRRSPLHSVYRPPHPVSGESRVDPHPVVPAITPESRIDPSREPKESNRDFRVENRDIRTEVKEMHSDAKRDAQGAKVDKDIGVEGESKEGRHDRDGHNEPRNDVKMDKDASGSSSGQLNWKDSKDYPRGKRYSESPGHLEPWHASRGSTQGLVEIGKEGQAVEDRDMGEGHDWVGNKADPRGEDRFKDKDRKRKDLKHREWADRDKEKVERRSSLQIGGNNNEAIKESVKEERGDSDRWERERKDLPKDRERPKDKEKEHTKRDPWNGVEKEGLHSDKEAGEGSIRVAEQEIPASDQKKQKDLESWKGVDRETRDRKKERDVDTDTERNEKRVRYEKEPDGCADGEGASERDREGFNSGVQQRKRMLRPRGSPLANRDPRFQPRSQENDGSQVGGTSGKSEVSSVVYKVGQCMQDLIKLWKEFEASQSEKNSESTPDGPTLEIFIPAEHVTATNRQVRGGQLWGTDIYTNDSDLVAVLMHTGYCRPTASPPPAGIQELRATIRVLPPQDCYTSMLRNNVRSRAWGAGIGCSYRVERCCIVKNGGGTIELEPCLTHTSAIEPTLAPVAVERTMTTRAAASNALRQQRFVREVTIQYNLCNEPWIKYSISVVADKGLKKSLYTSARMKKGEVLYLETHSSRYELCFAGEKMVKTMESSQAHEDAEKSNNHHPHVSNGDKNDSGSVPVDVFRWSRCKKPLPQKVMRSIGIPLPLEYVEVIEENVDWEDVQWSQTGVWVAGKEYTLARVHFLSPN